MTNIAWGLENAAAEWGDETAVIDADGSTYTYAEFDATASRIARYLRDEGGVEPDDVCSAILPDRFWTVAFMYGVLKLGAVATNENPTLPTDVLRTNLDTVGTSVLVVDERLRPDGSDLGETVESVETVVRFDRDGSGSDLRTDCADYEGSLEPVARTRDDLAMVNYTSGSTGQPKGVKLTHGTVSASIDAVDAAYHDLSRGDRSLSFLPMYHTGGISAAYLAVSNAATLVLTDGWDPERALEFTGRYDPDWWYYVVPTMVRDLRSTDDWADADLDGIKAFLVGEPAPEEIHQALREKGAETSCSYGMTETMPLAVALSPLGRRADPDLPPESVGKPATELGELEIVDLDTGEPIEEPGTSGEIRYRGDNLTPGYFGMPERTAAAIDEDGWFYTDDVGHVDEDGYVYVTGRADDVILSGGEKLSLVMVDDALLDHPLVEDGGAVGVAHERFGTVPAALVVPAEDVTEAELTARLDEYMGEELAGWQRPRLYAIVEEIPRTASKGTVIRPTLAEALPDDLTLARDAGVSCLDALGAATDESD